MRLHFIAQAFFGMVLLLAITSCGAARTAGPDPEGRNIVAAEAAYDKAVKAMDAADNEVAEKYLRAAIAADLYHGPAHNNLGIIFLERGDLYAAAEEFEWARKLLPGHPEPRVNLAIALYRGGRADEAFTAASGALEQRPGHLGAMQIRAWLCRAEGLEHAEVRDDLEAIALRSSDSQWKTWAQLQLAGLGDRPKAVP